MYSFHCELGLGYMTVPEMLETMHKNNKNNLMWYISLE